METLNKAVNEMADCFTSIQDAEVFTVLNCGEIEILAAVLRAAGREYAASHIIELHAEDDDEGDAHYVLDGDAAERPASMG